MKTGSRIRIGNQTAYSASSLFAPFLYAINNGFDAFEWFPDKKESGAGWDTSDLNGERRQYIRETALAHDIALTVHAQWWANPLQPNTHELIIQDIAFAQDIGATLFNIHLYTEKGIEAYIQALLPVINATRKAGLKLAIENTPLTTAADFNRLFALLRNMRDTPAEHVGICLDLGHANLSAATRNNYLAFIDQLDATLPIVHIHLHENYGDQDSHLVIFSGPAGTDDTGVYGFIERITKRAFGGSIILEQWPEPASLLNQARDRLLHMTSTYKVKKKSLARPGKAKPLKKTENEHGAPTGMPLKSSVVAATNDVKPSPGKEALLPDKEIAQDAFAKKIVAQDKHRSSWREKLAGVCDLLHDEESVITTESLIYLAIYLRFLGTGAVACREDGRHFRPSRLSRLSQKIQQYLVAHTSNDNLFILRKIYPWLPSYDSTFMRSEPLTRIRDIAHRNDIPQELKKEIKHTLQNKLHRCAGPEDLRTSESILARITAAGADYSPSFVEQFTIFHRELQEFFNAPSLEERLRTMLEKNEIKPKDLAKRFLNAKSDLNNTPDRQLVALERATELRSLLLKKTKNDASAQAQNMRLVDIGLEDFAFVLLSGMINSLATLQGDIAWKPALHGVEFIVDNLRISGVHPEECSAIVSAFHAWRRAFDPGDREQLLRLKATLARCRRLADTYSDTVLALFLDRVVWLGRALGVADHVIQTYCEGDIRGNLIFQLSKLVSLLLKEIRRVSDLPPWDILVPGKATGRLVAAEYLTDLTGPFDEEVLVLLERAEGDEEIPRGVAGIILCHELPHLSHFGVRCRQDRVVLVAYEDEEQLQSLGQYVGERLTFTVSGEGVTVDPAMSLQEKKKNEPQRLFCVPHVHLIPEGKVLELEKVTIANSGGKADGARRLAELSRQNGAGFHTPAGLVIPFGVLGEVLNSGSTLKKRYKMLMQRLQTPGEAEFLAAVEELRDLIETLSIPDELISIVMKTFAGNERLMVRSSANCEDLEELAGAGLYDSIANVAPPNVGEGVRKVWASLWTRRAAMSRRQAGIPHDQAHMAVLVQQMIVPEYSFIMHTVNPITARKDEIYLELAVGLGETLASGAARGEPYRLVCSKDMVLVQTLSFANFSHALWPHAKTGVYSETVDYAKVALSTDSKVRNKMGRHLAAAGRFVEAAFGGPQDIEGVIVGQDIYLVQSRPQPGV